MKTEIFEMLAITTSIMGVAFSAFTLYRKKKAENSVEAILKKRKAILENTVKDITKVLANSQDKLSIDEFKKIRDVLILLMEEMEEKEKKKILESLEQTSLKGQVDYLNKLIHMSGSNQTINVNINQ